MLLPTQQSAGLAATNLMQSAIDSADQRRAEQEEKSKGKKDDPILKARMSMDVAQARAKEKIDSYLFDSGHVSANELKLQLMDKLGSALGLKKEDDESGYGYGKKLETILSKMDYSAKRALEKEVGLDDLGISIDVMIAAIKNPYADDGEKLQTALEKQAGGGKEGYVQQSKALQRLENIADPKTVEELKLEAGSNDPTRIEDDEVRMERAQDISDKQAIAKLGDIRDLQDAVKQSVDPGAAATDGEAVPGADAAASLDLIQALAGAADAGTAADAQADADVKATQGEESDPHTEAKSAMTDAGLDPEAEIEPGDAKEAPILAVFVDEIGIYDLLKPRKAA